MCTIIRHERRFDMKGFFSVIMMNLIGFDMIIFLVAAANGVVFYLTKKAADELYRKMHLTVFVPGSEQSQIEAQEQLSSLRESDVVSMRNMMGRMYSVFINLTGIFPLPSRITLLQQALLLPKHIVPLNLILVGHPLMPQKPKNKWNALKVHYDTF